MDEPPPGRLAAAASVVKGLSLSNVLIIALLAVIAIPTYVIYRAMNDAAVMDRLLSSYKEIPNTSGCTLREVKTRGGPARWSISTGFAYHGNDRWGINVIVDQQPTEEQIATHCATLKLIADGILEARAP
jgi:hypothetical protein